MAQIKYLFILLSLSLTSLSWSQDCVDKNLVKAKNSPFNIIPAYNQDGTGTCYAFAASQLANYYLIKEKNYKKLSVHPLWAALTYSEASHDKTIKSGLTDGALRELSKSQICDYSLISKSLQKFTKENTLSDHEVMAFIETYGNSYQKEIEVYLSRARKLEDENKNYKYKVAIDNTYVHKIYKVHRSPADKAIEYSKIYALNEAKKNVAQFAVCGETDLNQFAMSITPLLKTLDIKTFKDLIFPECFSKLKASQLPTPESFSDLKASDENFAKNLRSHFTTSNQPLGIHYCSGVLNNPELDYIDEAPGNPKKSPGRHSTNMLPGCGPHASILVGSRPTKNSCEFLLRNTWGGDYGAWTKNWSCDCKNKKTGEYLKNCKAKTHPVSKYEVVGCWVPEKKLSKNLYGTQWLK